MDDHEYYARRAEEERRVAERACCPEARRRHATLAELLAGRAAQPAGNSPDTIR